MHPFIILSPTVTLDNMLMEKKYRSKRLSMQIETNATAVALLATWQHLSAEVEQIQMSPGPCFAHILYVFLFFLHSQQKA